MVCGVIFAMARPAAFEKRVGLPKIGQPAQRIQRENGTVVVLKVALQL
jgi:hypothetical protein